MRVFGVFLSLNGLLFILCEREKFYYFLLCKKYRSDISGITRKSTAKNLIDEADFLMRGMLGLGNIAMRYFLE